MKKILFILLLGVAIQGLAETIVKGTYDTTKKRYIELSQIFEKKENNIKNNISDKDKKLDYVRNYIAELVENNKAVIYERKTKKEIKNIVKVKYNNDIYYDAGRGSNYDGYKFYTDKSLSQEIMKFDIITQFGVALHSSLGDNPYNRELTEKEKEYREKNGNHFEELKGLYEKAVQNPNVEQKISY